jgi:hypothetical protein
MRIQIMSLVNISKTTLDTVGFFMVPTKDVKKHISALDDRGVAVLNQYTFKDPLGGQKGTGPEQTLLMLGTKDSPSQLISTMKSITPTLPYS